VSQVVVRQNQKAQQEETSLQQRFKINCEDFIMIIFEPVWISSDEHLAKLDAIYRQASIFDKLFGNYKLPPNYPYIVVHRGLFSRSKLPSVTITSGIVKIDQRLFSFQSKPFSILGTPAKNLLDLDFDLEATELVQVTRADAKSPAIKYYNMPFTRVQTKREGLLSNFLVCVGGTGPSMKEINLKSDELFLDLEKLLQGQG
jgi:hypothetical protein